MVKTTGEARRTARGTATRNRIVVAAAELMRARGVGNTSLDAVLEASDASKSQLYHYFADKDDLVLAVVQRQADCVLASHNAHLRNVTAIAGLRRWRDSVVELTRKQNCAGGCPLGSLVSELAESPASRAALAAGFGQWQSDIAAALEAAAAGTKSITRTELNELAILVLTSLQGGLLMAQTTRSTQPLELALDAAIDRVSQRLTSTATRASTGASTRRSPTRRSRR